MNPDDNEDGAGSQQAADADSPKSSVKKSRIYRACVHCRQRKSKCLLDAGPTTGLPPCRRCVREGRECVLAGSRRGGRRPKKSRQESQPEDLKRSPSTYEHEPQHGFVPMPAPIGGSRGDSAQWNGWERDQSTDTVNNGVSSVGEAESMDNSIDSAKIQNPSDALEILAQVAGDAQPENDDAENNTWSRHEFHSTGANGHLQSFKPYKDGKISLEMIHGLFLRYKEKYHPYFPIVPDESFDIGHMGTMASAEPHLFAAILTIASADTDTDVHNACSDYVRGQLAELIYGGDGDIEAVEALLILSEWATIWQPSSTSTGKGLEDRSAWMLVGMAVRLAVYLGLEHTSFRTNDPGKMSPNHHRRRLVWTACYMADRQVSIRVGKGFWSRGPGPTSFFESKDFPSLKPKGPGDTDYASIFKANLELINIFSNIKDVLYGHGMKLILSSGIYVKYIDDFRTAIRSWHSVYMHGLTGSACPPFLKVTLLILYDYIRLYCNAFALQASFPKLGGSRPYVTVGQMPDARFIYEAVDAAKSLLTTVNNFVDPENCLRYLPLRFYLYIIYSTVFLYKATGTMSKEEKDTVTRMISDTVMCLRKSSTNTYHIGTRYAKLISLLWRRPPKQKEARHSMGPPATPNGTTFPPTAGSTGSSDVPDGDLGFSWLDLSAVGDFATRNNSVSLNFADFDLPETNSSYIDAYAENQHWFNNESPSFIF